jgi:hypothetical protein
MTGAQAANTSSSFAEVKTSQASAEKMTVLQQQQLGHIH